MRENHYCEICGQPGQQHHIVFRRKSAGMINAEINFKYLCVEHHNGNNGPHKNKKTNVKYKLELQKKLFDLFQNDYYHKRDISKLLKINLKDTDILTKTLKWHPEGYARVDIVIACMGEKLYAE